MRKTKFAWLAVLALYVLLVARGLYAQYPTNPSGVFVFPSAGITTPVTVKSFAADLYGFSVYNQSASVCYLEFIQGAGGTLGANAIFSVAIPATSSVTVAQAAMKWLTSAPSGLSVGAAAGYNGSSACGSGMLVAVFYQ
jgi:hypothetical protein